MLLLQPPAQLSVLQVSLALQLPITTQTYPNMNVQLWLKQFQQILSKVSMACYAADAAHRQQIDLQGFQMSAKAGTQPAVLTVPSRYGCTEDEESSVGCLAVPPGHGSQRGRPAQHHVNPHVYNRLQNTTQS